MIARLARVLLVCFVAVAALCLVCVQVQQRMYKHHVDRLLADLNTVELHKSTWADAQRLMKSWGRWGHWEGQCSAEACRYDILLEDVAERMADGPKWLYPVLQKLDPFYVWLGGRAGTVRLALVVRRGTIVRSGLYAMQEVIPERVAGEDFHSYALRVGAVSVPRLVKNGEPTYARDGPYYSARRPGGCTSCEMVTLVYSDHAPADLVRSLTGLDTSCIAGTRRCVVPEDLLPAARPFHFYDDAGEERPPEAPQPCMVPLWVRGRDASEIIRIAVLHTGRKKNGSYAEDTSSPFATVRILETVKGVPFPAGSHADIFSFTPSEWNPGVPEPLELGKSYFVFGFDGLGMQRQGPPELGVQRCTSVQVTVEGEAELRRGIELDDELVGAELDHWPF